MVETREMEAAATDTGGPGGGRSTRRRGGAGASGLDRGSVILFSLAAFLAVLALLAWEMRPSSPTFARRREVVVRRVYETTVVETIKGSSGSGTSVSQSVSSSG